MDQAKTIVGNKWKELLGKLVEMSGQQFNHLVRKLSVILSRQARTIMEGMATTGRGVRMLGVAIRILKAVFLVSAPLFALLIVLSWIGYDSLVELLGPAYFIRFAGALIGAVLLSSGLLLWNELRNNPLEETDRGEWTGNQLLYSIVFAITLFISAFYLPTLFFSL